MTVAQLMHGISNREYVDWQALYHIEAAEREREQRRGHR